MKQLIKFLKMKIISLYFLLTAYFWVLLLKVKRLDFSILTTMLWGFNLLEKLPLYKTQSREQKQAPEKMTSFLTSSWYNLRVAIYLLHLILLQINIVLSWFYVRKLHWIERFLDIIKIWWKLWCFFFQKQSFTDVLQNRCI